jgi:hypothetical protein
MKTGILNNNGTITTWVDAKEKTKKDSHRMLSKTDAQSLGATLMVYGDDGNIWMMRPGAKPSYSSFRQPLKSFTNTSSQLKLTPSMTRFIWRRRANSS